MRHSRSPLTWLSREAEWTSDCSIAPYPRFPLVKARNYCFLPSSPVTSTVWASTFVPTSAFGPAMCVLFIIGRRRRTLLSFPPLFTRESSSGSLPIVFDYPERQTTAFPTDPACVLRLLPFLFLLASPYCFIVALLFFYGAYAFCVAASVGFLEFFSILSLKVFTLSF